MFGLLARLGTSAVGVLKGAYKGLDASVGGLLPGGVPRAGVVSPVQRGTRPRGFPAGPVGFGAGMGVQRLSQGPGVGPGTAVTRRPQAQMGSVNGSQAYQMTPSSRNTILWVTDYPYPPQGYVVNKSAYYRTDPASGQPVYIPKGSVWRRRRRTNPLNPRAASRAISRIESGKRAANMFARVTIRAKK